MTDTHELFDHLKDFVNYIASREHTLSRFECWQLAIQFWQAGVLHDAFFDYKEDHEGDIRPTFLNYLKNLGPYNPNIKNEGE